MNDDNGALARRVEALRIQKGMTYRELARKAGINMNTLRDELRYRRSRALAWRMTDIVRALELDDETAKELEDMVEPVWLEEKEMWTLKKAPRPADDLAVRPPCRKGRYDAILKAINDGESDGKILRDWPELTSDVLIVYHKIARGEIYRYAQRGGMYDKGGMIKLARIFDIDWQPDTEIGGL